MTLPPTRLHQVWGWPAVKQYMPSSPYGQKPIHFHWVKCELQAQCQKQRPITLTGVHLCITGAEPYPPRHSRFTTIYDRVGKVFMAASDSFTHLYSSLPPHQYLWHSTHASLHPYNHNFVSPRYFSPHLCIDQIFRSYHLTHSLHIYDPP